MFKFNWQGDFTNQMNWFFVLMVWDAIWRGIALWKSARHGQRNWFVALFLVNSVGILPIVYLKFFQAKTKARTKTKK